MTDEWIDGGHSFNPPFRSAAGINKCFHGSKQYEPCLADQTATKGAVSSLLFAYLTTQADKKSLPQKSRLAEKD